MSDVAPYMTRLYHGPGTWVRVFVNDLPMYDKPSDASMSSDFPATPWLVPGENDLAIEVLEVPLPPNVGRAPRFDLLFWGEGPSILAGGPASKVPLFETSFPKFLAELPPEARDDIPVRYEAKFTPEGNIPPPIWADASPETIPERGSPELLKPLFDLHQAFKRKDVDGFLGALDLKFEDQRRYHGNSPRLARAEVRVEHEEFFQARWDVPEFTPETLRFRACNGGRVVYAHNEKGGPAFEARSPTAAWNVRPFLIRRGADWRIYR